MVDQSVLYIILTLLVTACFFHCDNLLLDWCIHWTFPQNEKKKDSLQFKCLPLSFSSSSKIVKWNTRKGQSNKYAGWQFFGHSHCHHDEIQLQIRHLDLHLLRRISAIIPRMALMSITTTKTNTGSLLKQQKQVNNKTLNRVLLKVLSIAIHDVVYR